MARWLSAPRHAVYLEATGGDQQRALTLYEWNAQLGAALLRDPALRNAYDGARALGSLPQARWWPS